MEFLLFWRPKPCRVLLAKWFLVKLLLILVGPDEATSKVTEGTFKPRGPELIPKEPEGNKILLVFLLLVVLEGRGGLFEY